MAINFKQIIDKVNNWKAIVGIISSIGIIVSAVYAIDNHFALKQEVVVVALDLQDHKIEQRVNELKTRIWDYQDRLEKKVSPELKKELQGRIRELQDEKSQLENKLQLIRQEKK